MEVTPQRDRVAKPYKGRFWSAKSFVMHTLHDSKSAQMRQKVLAFVERRRLMGRGLGWVDVHLLASAVLAALPLWTSDKHLQAVARALGVGP